MLRVPYIDYINDYITNFKDKQVKNEKLLYFKNLKKIRRYSVIGYYIAWCISLVCALIYGFTRENYGLIKIRPATEPFSEEVWIISLDVAFLPIIGLNFMVPLTFRICEAWSNAAMSQLFD